jgi:GNAT superfamily N-acetyltransferase
VKRTYLGQAGGVCLRQACAGDEELIRSFLAGLSPRTQYLRFFAGMARPSARMLSQLVTAEDRQRDALVAVCGGAVIGHALAAQAGQGEVEVAVVVADRWQGRGVGLRLINELLLTAASRGSERIRMDVLWENRVMLRLVQRAWPWAEYTLDGDCVVVRAALSPEGVVVAA